MTIDAIKTLADAQPFQPFELRLAGGPAIAVDHPDFIAFGPKGRTIFVYRADESFRILDVMLITEVDARPRRAAKRHR